MGAKFNEYEEKLYRLLRETPKDKLPGLDNCPEYQELYDSARENDEYNWCWFSETMDVVSYDLCPIQGVQWDSSLFTDMANIPSEAA